MRTYANFKYLYNVPIINWRQVNRYFKKMQTMSLIVTFSFLLINDTVWLRGKKQNKTIAICKTPTTWVNFLVTTHWKRFCSFFSFKLMKNQNQGYNRIIECGEKCMGYPALHWLENQRGLLRQYLASCS